MHPLLTLRYWFDTDPAPFHPGADRALLVFFAVLLLAGIVVWMLRLRGGYDKIMKKALARFASHLTWTGVVGLALWGIAYEQIPWLSVRVLFVVWGLWFLAGLWFVGRFVWVDMPAMNARRKEQEAQQKWLPKRKR